MRSPLLIGGISALLLAIGTAPAKQITQQFSQPEARNASGQLTVEAATIRVISCNGSGENGRFYYIYQYMKRPGFRVIIPPNWASAIGGGDWGSWSEAVAAADCAAAPPPVIVEAPRYLGCFKDDQSRDLSGATFSQPTMSTNQCVSWCRGQGFAYAGTQFSSHCFCGQSYGRYGPANNCDMACSGSPGEKCGGTWANSIYSIR